MLGRGRPQSRERRRYAGTGAGTGTGTGRRSARGFERQIGAGVGGFFRGGGGLVFVEGVDGGEDALDAVVARGGFEEDAGDAREFGGGGFAQIELAFGEAFER